MELEGAVWVKASCYSNAEQLRAAFSLATRDRGAQMMIVKDVKPRACSCCSPAKTPGDPESRGRNEGTVSAPCRLLDKAPIL